MGQGHSIVAFGECVHEHKFIASQASHHTLSPERAFEPPCHFSKQVVSHQIALRVVDLLEAVEIDEQHSGLLASLACYVEQALSQIYTVKAIR